jgi:hypothetical protein
MTDDNDPPTKSIISSVREIIGILSAFAGLLAALIYLSGRYYSLGYYAAMNVPEYMISYSIMEYGAIAWQSIVLQPTILFLVSSGGFYLILKLLQLLYNWKPIFQFIDKLRKKINKNLTISQKLNDNDLQKVYSFVFIFSLFLLMIAITFSSVLSSIYQQGYTNGNKNLLGKSQRIQIQSSSPIYMDNQLVILQSGEKYFFDDFFLLVLNKGKYYLFKELDPNTCKPSQVYIIDESKIDQVILSPAEDLSDQCLSN